MTKLPEYLKQVSEREENATIPPWQETEAGSVIQTKHITRDVWHIPRTFDDVRFIAHARTDVPTLLKIIEKMREALSRIPGKESKASLDCFHACETLAAKAMGDK